MFELIPFERENSDLLKNFKDFERKFFSDSTANWGLKSDVRDMGDKFILDTDLPGFNKNDITINTDQNYLTISAKRENDVEAQNNSGNYLRRERSYGTFKRSFSISGVAWDKIQATYNDGVLQVTLPKSDGKSEYFKRIDIQ